MATRNRNINAEEGKQKYGDYKETNSYDFKSDMNTDSVYLSVVDVMVLNGVLEYR